TWMMTGPGCTTAGACCLAEERGHGNMSPAVVHPGPAVVMDAPRSGAFITLQCMKGDWGRSPQRVEGLVIIVTGDAWEGGKRAVGVAKLGNQRVRTRLNPLGNPNPNLPKIAYITTAAAPKVSLPSTLLP
ncbi:hypothetical protein BU15DRAFT_68752, partial [Melanogaster broomeanus]